MRGAQSVGYRTVLPVVGSNRELARQANSCGVASARAGDLKAAEVAFREALRADLSCAAAHCNLGNILLSRGQLYEAALEFAFAAKVDSRAVEPKINLGRLYETAGWHAAAVEEYEKALSLDRDNTEAMGRLAFVCLQSEGNSQSAASLLRGLAQANRNSRWKRWASRELDRSTGLASQ